MQFRFFKDSSYNKLMLELKTEHGITFKCAFCSTEIITKSVMTNVKHSSCIICKYGVGKWIVCPSCNKSHCIDCGVTIVEIAPYIKQEHIHKPGHGNYQELLQYAYYMKLYNYNKYGYIFKCFNCRTIKEDRFLQKARCKDCIYYCVRICPNCDTYICKRCYNKRRKQIYEIAPVIV